MVRVTGATLAVSILRLSCYQKTLKSVDHALIVASHD
jgi:hypothetical protein